MFSFNKFKKQTTSIPIENNIIYKTKDVELIKCFINDLDLKNIDNWKKNRPVDTTRSSEICDYYVNNNIILIPGIIYAWKKDNEYIIFDGIHRFLAGIKSTKNMILLLQIHNTQDEEIIKQAFLNINKSISLPLTNVRKKFVKML